jgi:hypothetical protein
LAQKLALALGHVHDSLFRRGIIPHRLSILLGDKMAGTGQSGGIGGVLKFIFGYVEASHVNGQAGEPKEDYQAQGRYYHDGPLCSLNKFFQLHSSLLLFLRVQVWGPPPPLRRPP